MLLLKPCGLSAASRLALQQVINVLTEGRIGQHALELVPRDRLQDNPRILREVPEGGIKRAPHFVGGMVPRPAHVQSELRQRIEPLDFRGKKAVYRVADACLFAHRSSPNLFWTEFRVHQFGFARRLLVSDGGATFILLRHYRQSIADDRLGFLQDAAQMIRSPEALSHKSCRYSRSLTDAPRTSRFRL